MIIIQGGEHLRFIVDRRLINVHQDHIRNELKTHGAEVKTELKRVTSTGKRSGRFYTYRGRKYQASAEGEPPAKRSGRLSDSFMYRSRPMELLIGNTAFSKKGFPYPWFLEERMNRPYFTVTIDRLQYRLERGLLSLV